MPQAVCRDLRRMACGGPDRNPGRIPSSWGVRLGITAPPPTPVSVRRALRRDRPGGAGRVEGRILAGW